MLVDDKAVVGDDCANFVLLLLATHEEDLVVNLDGSEVFGQDLSVAQTDLSGRLRGQLVDHQLAVDFVIIVQTGLVLRENEVGLEADHIVKESSELVDFTPNDDVRARVVFQVLLVVRNLLLELLCSFCQVLDLAAKLEHIKEVFRIGECFLLGNASLEVFLECFKVDKCLLSEVLRRGSVLLYALKVLNREECLLSLLVHDGLELIVLMLDLLHNLLFDSLLLHHDGFHGGTGGEGSVSLIEQLFELADLESAGLLEGHTATAAAV